MLNEPPAVFSVGLVARLLKVPPEMCELGGAAFQGVTRVEQADFIRPMQIQLWMCG